MPKFLRMPGIFFLTLKKPAVACGHIARSQSRCHSQSVMPCLASIGTAASMKLRNGPHVTNGVMICLAPASVAHFFRRSGDVGSMIIGDTPTRCAASANAPLSNWRTCFEIGRGDRNAAVLRVVVVRISKAPISKSSIRQS